MDDFRTIQPADEREGIYRDLHGGQLAAQEAANAASAERILDIVREYYQPASVLDVGCGLGTWLKVAQARGIADIMGVEGAWLDRSKLQVDGARVRMVELEKSFDLGRQFDLAICLEVAEHLSADAADAFVASLTRHAPVVLFSAAIPYQGGHHHVNERFLPYWMERFAHHGYRPLNVIRGKIWDDPTILWWLRQNIVLFAKHERIAGDERLRRAAEESDAYPLSVVHPDVYVSRVGAGFQAIEQLQRIAGVFGQGGMFRVTLEPNGSFTITKA
jgi:SAM-dependent methyltransferase